MGLAQREFAQHYPKPGWVEHDPLEIWKTQRSMLLQVMREHRVKAGDIAAIGITNQRETTVIWDRDTGKPVHNAIVWQDRRTAPICEQLKSRGLEKYIRQSTGLVVDAYFSGTKIKWLLDNVRGVRERANKGRLLFGTIDTWLIWNLTKGKVHTTDYSNASRTMLYNIRKLSWDQKLLKALNIPASLLPQVRNSSGDFGSFELDGINIPILGVAGDQQAALFGQGCFEKGMTKNTYGTGCFLLMNTGSRPFVSKSGLLTTIAWGLDGRVEYALEGSVLIAGAAIQWLRDGLKIIGSAKESEALALKAAGSDEVVVVPAFAGLGAPYWDMYARGAIFGLTRGTGREHIVKATLESLAFQTRDVLSAMQKDTGLRPRKLRVDGGACANNFLMQFQADILGTPVERPKVIESTAYGAACLAGIAAGLWKKEEITGRKEIGRTFRPSMTHAVREKRYAKWKKAVKRSMKWLDA